MENTRELTVDKSKLFFTTTDVCRILKIGMKKCLALFHRDDFPCLIYGKTFLIEKDSFVFIEQNTVLSNKDIGLFFYNGNYLLRRLIYKRGKFALKADNRDLKDINISNSDIFYIVGKIYV